MKLELKFLTIALISIVLAIPVAIALQHRTHQLKIQRSQNTNLQLQIKSEQKKLQEKEQQNQQLKKKLQSKREAQAKVVSRQVPQAPVAVSGSGNCNTYRGIVARYKWNVNIAMAIMHAESKCDPTATSPTCDHGLMQINCVHRAMVGGNLKRLNDPATNIRIAYAIYSGRGNWSDWTTYTSGAYLQYL